MTIEQRRAEVEQTVRALMGGQRKERIVTEVDQERAEARAQFLDLISAYSEENRAAAWLVGIEETVRTIGGVWLAMAVLCGGWPKGYRAEDGWDPLTTIEWNRWHRLTEGRQ